MQIIYPEIKEEEKKKAVCFDDDTLDGVSEKDLERLLERTKSLKEATYLDNEANEAKEKKEAKRCCVRVEVKPCCLYKLPVIKNLEFVQKRINAKTAAQ
ncbi:hypothetical protein PFISCL1PPCAC_22980 [Pristionchus fissidentatus]|uniref:Uncharacterized protein n=1 Tax=Pristionchus fissidentatus TaxID=1538716 RepID=A0AAV5WJS2_9BILA|nr:hypothetical protein PFISCL1PPCAC_22980 [Pristionchus fissidentatus]